MYKWNLIGWAIHPNSHTLLAKESRCRPTSLHKENNRTFSKRARRLFQQHLLLHNWTLLHHRGMTPGHMCNASARPQSPSKAHTKASKHLLIPIHTLTHVGSRSMAISIVQGLFSFLSSINIPCHTYFKNPYVQDLFRISYMFDDLLTISYISHYRVPPPPPGRFVAYYFLLSLPRMCITMRSNNFESHS